MVASDDGSLSREEYDKTVLALIDFGDQVVSIDGGVLVAATRQDDGSSRCFDRVVSLLGGPQAEMLSHISVAVDFLGYIWPDRPDELSTAKQTGMMLKNLLKGQAEWQALIALLRWIYRDRFGLDGRLDKYILNWLQGHFLVPFEKRSLPLAGFVDPSSRT